MAKVQFGFASANALSSRQVLPLLVAGTLAWGAGAFGHYFASPYSMPNTVVASGPSVPAEQDMPDRSRPVLAQVAEDVQSKIEQTAPVQALEAVGNMAANALQSAPEYFDRQVELAEGESFSALLSEADVQDSDVTSVVKEINRIYEHKRLRDGQEFTLGFVRRGNEETLQSIVFQPEPTKEITVARQADGAFMGKILVTPLERQRLAKSVEIATTLRDAGRKAGVPANIMAALNRVYSHSVDFQRDIHRGDKFEVLYDQPTSKDGKPVGDGTIIYAALEVDGKIKPLYRVTFGDGTVDYFDAAGQSIKRALLRTPVDNAHLTSGFGVRMHPLLGYSKMHKGTDFGAPPGTPIFAAGAGTVEEVGFKGAYGRYVRLRHNGKTETAYAHMSRFARSIYRGAHVNQGEVIGFVGASGRATGPHLHFEVLVNGDQVNPMSVSSMPMGRVLDGQALNQFRQGQKRIRQEFTDLLTKRPSDEALVSPAPLPAPKPAVHTSQAVPVTAPKS